MACADQLDMVFEAWRNGLGPVRVAFDKLDDLLRFLLLPPCVEGFQVLKDQGVAVVHVAGPIRASLGAPRGGILESRGRGRGRGRGSLSGGRGTGR